MYRSRSGNSARSAFQSGIVNRLAAKPERCYSARNLGQAGVSPGLDDSSPLGAASSYTSGSCTPGRSSCLFTERALFPLKENRMISEMRAPARLSYGRIPNLVELKDLIATQVESFHWFKSEGLRELFDEINPITDYTGKTFELKFLDYEFGQPKFSVEECRNRDMTYAAPLRIKTRLTIKETGEIKESEVYICL